jgi:hypothetical protein
MATVERASGSMLRVYAGDGFDESELLSVAEARTFAAELLQRAAEVEEEQARVKALCEADGHQWWGYDAWSPFPARKVFVERCERDGCDARREFEGWRNDYPPKEHVFPPPWGTNSCTGPGCHWCEQEQMAEGLQRVLAEALPKLEALVEEQSSGEGVA